MSSISNYLKMNAEELENEINKQNKKISSAKETISLLKKLQIAANATNHNQQRPQPQMSDRGM